MGRLLVVCLLFEFMRLKAFAGVAEVNTLPNTCRQDQIIIQPKPTEAIQNLSEL